MNRIIIHTAEGASLLWTRARTEALAWHKFVGVDKPSQGRPVSKAHRMSIEVAKQAGYKAVAVAVA